MGRGAGSSVARRSVIDDSAIHRMACAILTKEALTGTCPVNFVLHIFSFILFICKIIKTIYIYFGVLI